MSQESRDELLPRQRQQYEQRNRAGKSRFLDEFCAHWSCDRKYAIKLLSGRVGWGGQLGMRKGRPPKYGPEVVKVLSRIWSVAEQPCGKRLKALLPLWIEPYEAEYGPLDATVRASVLAVSAAQIDRLLAAGKVADRRCLGGTKPGSLLKTQIPIRTDNWDVTGPGYLEADTVAHCGGSMAGDFIWSVTYTDIYSGWTSLRAVYNRGAEGVLEATRDVESALQFKLLGFDCDNGSEFLNWHLVKYFQERNQVVAFTRSRPYHKDDNGHVEQKNWSHVRQLLGYERLEDPELIEPINRLYRLYWEPLNNHFLPSAKMVHKEREGAKVTRRHDTPMTPCDRLLNCPQVDDATKASLRATRQNLNPFELKRDLEAALAKILAPARGCDRPTASLRPGQTITKP